MVTQDECFYWLRGEWKVHWWISYILSLWFHVLLCSRGSVHTLLVVDSDDGLVLSLFQWQRTTRETKSAFLSTLKLLRVEFMPFESLSLLLQTRSCTSFLAEFKSLMNIVKYQIGLKRFVSANILDPKALPTTPFLFNFQSCCLFLDMSWNWLNKFVSLSIM